MTIDWLTDDEQVVERAGTIEGGLSWLALATGEATGDGTIEFVASTPAIDRMGDSIDQQTWKLANYRRNPVFLADHNGKDVVGRVPRVGRTATEAGAPELRIRVLFDESELNPRGMLLAHQHRNGFRNAVSVGFIPGESTNRTELAADHPLYVDPKTTSRWMAGYLFRHSELLEVSSVSVPANPQALQLGIDARAAGGDQDAIAKFIRESTSKSVSEHLLHAARHDPEFRRAVLGLIYSERATPNPTVRGGLDHLWSQR